MMKKFLSSLLLGAFVFGLGAADVQVANAAVPFKKLYFSRKHRPEKTDNFREQTGQRHRIGKTQQKYR